MKLSESYINRLKKLSGIDKKSLNEVMTPQEREAAKLNWLNQHGFKNDNSYDYEGVMGVKNVSYDEYFSETHRPIDVSFLAQEIGHEGSDPRTINHFGNMQFKSAGKAFGFGDDFKRTYNPNDYYYLVDVTYDIDGNPENKNTALFGVTRDGSNVSLHAN